jgi:hypothetical protein
VKVTAEAAEQLERLLRNNTMPDNSELREASLKKLRVLAKEIATLKRQKAMLGKLLENWPRKKGSRGADTGGSVQFK